MQSYTVSEAKTTLETLIGKPLSSIAKKDGEIVLGFGEDESYGGYNENFEVIWSVNESPQYYLQIGTEFRFTLRNRIILVKQDMSSPSYKESTKVGFDWKTYDYSGKGTTRFEEQVERFFSDDVIEDYVVSEVKVGEGQAIIIGRQGNRFNIQNDDLCIEFTSDEDAEYLTVMGFFRFILEDKILLSANDLPKIEQFDETEKTIVKEVNADYFGDATLLFENGAKLINISLLPRIRLVLMVMKITTERKE